MALLFYYKDTLGNDAKNPAIFGCLLPKEPS